MKKHICYVRYFAVHFSLLCLPCISPLTSAGSLPVSLTNPNAACLVYKAGDSTIDNAMQNIGAVNVRYRSNYDPVTAEDWEWCDIVIVGSNDGSESTSGISARDIEFGITGRVILSGHDTDLHASDQYYGDTKWAAQVFLIQAINYVLAGQGKGLLGFGDTDSGFGWTPASWEVAYTIGFNNEQVTSITEAGLSSGVFEHLTTELMSYWSHSFHVRFDAYADGFVPFELGNFNSQPNDGVITIGTPVHPRKMVLLKWDDVPDNTCVEPDEELTYTLYFENKSSKTFYDAWVVDYLPAGVSYPGRQWQILFGDPNDPNAPPFLVPPDPGYDEGSHSYVWPLGDIAPYESGYVELPVMVNIKAVPGGILHNTAELWAMVYDPNGQNPDTVCVARATEQTSVCCWADISILYVDQAAVKGSNSGLNWQNAFLDLQDALAYARSALCGQVHSIYVAQGTYHPGGQESDTFEIPDGVWLYGGFPKGGGAFERRNPSLFKTILTGRIDETTRNDTVAKMGHETLLDGFTVTEASQDGQGIYGSGADFAVTNCRIENNENYGLYAVNCNVDLKWCTIRNNKADGIRHSGVGKSLILENVWVRQSGEYGINCTNSTPVIRNSIVSESALAEAGRAGLRMINPTYSPLLHNCTLAHNRSAAVFWADNHNAFGDPNCLDYPEIQNSIIYHNNAGGPQLMGFSADDCAWYSCIEDANSVNYNISVNPQFAYFDPNNVRLSPASLCRNASNPSLDYSSQLDMDGNPRVYGTIPDMGAYEMTCDYDVSNPLDWNADGLVNLEEFNLFARAWLSRDPNDPAWLADPMLYETNLAEGWYEWKHKLNLDNTGASAYQIDLADLLYWLAEAPYLWRACWVSLPEPSQMTAGGGEMLRMGDVISAKAGIQSVSKLSAEEQLFTLATTAAKLEQLWLEAPDIRQKIDADDWSRFMDAIYQGLRKLQTDTIRAR